MPSGSYQRLNLLPPGPPRHAITRRLLFDTAEWVELRCTWALGSALLCAGLPFYNVLTYTICTDAQRFLSAAELATTRASPASNHTHTALRHSRMSGVATHLGPWQCTTVCWTPFLSDPNLICTNIAAVHSSQITPRSSPLSHN
jgi:hypothetical protein